MHTRRQEVLSSLRLEGSGVPIYVQLREQFLRAIGEGRLAPGDQMPTMREVAVALKIDLNTVRHAYDALERAGAIRLERGRGSFVTASNLQGASPPGEASADGLARRAIALAAAAGVDPLVLAGRIVALAQSEEHLP